MYRVVIERDGNYWEYEVDGAFIAGVINKVEEAERLTQEKRGWEKSEEEDYTAFTPT